MEYDNFLENVIRFYCTTLYFYCLHIYLLYKLFVIIMFITCNLILQKILTKTSCYSAVDFVVSVMVYDIETVLVAILKQDRQACYNAVIIAVSTER